jgi:propanol-preferring alcohol dehydrogenase
MEVISLAQAGKIKMLVEHFPLERAAEAYHLLHDGKIQGRAVITPNGRVYVARTLLDIRVRLVP